MQRLFFHRAIKGRFKSETMWKHGSLEYRVVQMGFSSIKFFFKWFISVYRCTKCFRSVDM